jgi:hypothetical protein
MTDSKDPFGSAAQGSSPAKQDVSQLKRQLEEEETSQLNVEIPKSLHKQLKIHCLETEQEIREVVKDLLVEYLSE